MSLSERLHLHRYADPDRVQIPMGGSRNELLALLLVLFVLCVVVLSFWFQATH